MGRIKELMLEQEALEQNGAKVEFICPNKGCGRWIEHFCEIPYPNLMAEKQSEITQTDEFEVWCSGCENVYEASITNDSALLEVKVEGHPDLEVEVEAPDHYYQPDDDYLWDGIPDDPYSIFQENWQALSEFVEENCHEILNTLENRMALVQAWSTFEAYLCDRLAWHLDKNREALIRFSRGDDAIKDMEINVAELISSRGTIEKLVIGSVRGRLYHKFGPAGKLCKNSSGVPAWYRLGMQLEIAPDLKILDQLREHAVIRHDCVHRNGKDKDGEERHDIVKSKILEVLQLMRNTAEHIEHVDNQRLPF